MAQIRAAVLADVPAIAAMVEHYWRVEAIGGFQRNSVEATLTALLSHARHGACWVADNDGILCGYLAAVFMLSIEHGGWMAEIDEFFIEAEQRSAGLGSQLLAAAERDMAVLGLKRLQLQLKRGNERSLAFYQRRGYRCRAGYEVLDKPLGG